MTSSFADIDNESPLIMTFDDLVSGASEAHLAVQNRDIEHLTSLSPESLLIKDCDGETPLHYAATNDDLEICKILIKMNPGILQIKDIDNKTAYDWALAYNSEYNSHQEVCAFLSR